MKTIAAVQAAAPARLARLRLGLWLVSLWVAWAAAAQGATPSAPAPSHGAQDRPVVAQAGAASAPTGLPMPSTPAPARYVDRVIERSDAQGDEQDDEPETPYDAQGRPRQLRVDLRGLRERGNASGAYTSGHLSLFGAIETFNHGLLSIDANFRRESRAATADSAFASGVALQSQSSLFTLRQRALPMGRGVTVNNDLGAIGFASPGLGRMTSRVFMPSHRVLGANTQWQQEEQGWQALAAVGQPLQFDGVYASSVQRVPGLMAQTGAALNRKLDGGGLWHVGSQWVQARQVDARGAYATAWPAGAVPTDRFDAQSVWLGAGLERSDWQVQAHGLVSQLDGSSSIGSQGAWIDVNRRMGSYRHAGGVYYLGNGLTWGGLPMSSGVSGAYYRGAWYSRTWLFDGSLDLLQSQFQSSDSSRGYFATANMRRRVDSDLSWGASAVARDFNGRGYNAALDTTLRSDWGSTNARAEMGRELANQQNWRLTMHHDWALDSGWTLANSAGVGRSRSGGVSSPLWLVAASALVPITPQTSFRGTANLENVNNSQRRAVNLALSHRFAPVWLLEVGFSLERGQTQTVRSLDPLAPPSLVAPRTINGQTMYLLLRYDFSAGSRSVPLGGLARDGGGSVQGVVFLDQNKNGRQDAGERGAAGVTVALDGKYLTQTDSDGRFAFAWVSGGSRQVTVLNETLPLPWSVPESGRTEVVVQLRETANVSIAAVQ